jgi:hypothetical protein
MKVQEIWELCLIPVFTYFSKWWVECQICTIYAVLFLKVWELNQSVQCIRHNCDSKINLGKEKYKNYWEIKIKSLLIRESYVQEVMYSCQILSPWANLSSNKIKYYISEIKVDIKLCTSSFSVVTSPVFLCFVEVTSRHMHVMLAELSSVPFCFRWRNVFCEAESGLCLVVGRA